MSSKDALHDISDLGVGQRCCRWFGCRVKAATGHFEDITDLANAGPAFLSYEQDHLAILLGVLVPRKIAAFFKMSFSTRRSAFSRRRMRSSFASASSSGSCWTRRPPLPICAFCGSRNPHRPRFELCCISSSVRCFHCGLFLGPLVQESSSLQVNRSRLRSLRCTVGKTFWEIVCGMVSGAGIDLEKK